MRSNFTVCMDLYFHSVALFCNPGDAFQAEARRSGSGVRILGPWSCISRNAAPFQILSVVQLSTSWDSSQLRNPLPPINKVSPPAMKHRDLHPNLMSSMSHLRSNQSDRSSDPLDVFLPIKRRQYQIPYPERQIVCQLSTKQVDPIAHESFHGKMKEKLIRKLGNPSLTHPSLVMKLQNLLNVFLPVRHDHIIGKAHHLKEGRLPALGRLLLTSNQIPEGMSPFDRLIPHLPIAQRLILRVLLPCRLRQPLNLFHQRTRLIRRDGKGPFPFFTHLHHVLRIKRRITPKVHRLDCGRDLPLQSPQKSRSPRPGVRIARS